MKQIIIATILTSLVFFPSFAQNSSRKNDSVFVNGIQFNQPSFDLTWQFSLDQIPANKLKNYQVKKRRWGSVEIKFDSILILDNFFIQKVKILGQLKGKTDKYKIIGFAGLIDLETLEKMEAFFNYYKYLGWVTYPKTNPNYKFRLIKDKNDGGIAIMISGRF